MTLTKFFGLAEVDSLLSEFILDDLNDQNTAPGAVAIKQHLASSSFVTSAVINTSQSTSQPGSILNPGSNASLLEPILSVASNGTVPLLQLGIPQPSSMENAHPNSVETSEPVMTIL